jgi:hypothetical protein
MNYLGTRSDPAKATSEVIMCNLCRLKVAQNDLPPPTPYDRCWKSAKKIVDTFHHKNHVDPSCKEKFSPNEHPTYNTQAGEQTLFCVGSEVQTFIVCYEQDSSSFLLTSHDLEEKLIYTETCYRLGKKPKLPQLNYESN